MFIIENGKIKELLSGPNVPFDPQTGWYDKCDSCGMGCTGSSTEMNIDGTVKYHICWECFDERLKATA